MSVAIKPQHQPLADDTATSPNEIHRHAPNSHLERHQLSAAFPDMPPDEFDELVADIAKNGLRDRGWTYEGKILDGWHRYKACIAAGRTFRCDEYRGTDPVGLVLSKNICRRNLTASQRAAAIVAFEKWRPRGDQRSAQGAERAPTAAEMARQAHVGTRTIEQAKKAHEAGLGEAVKAGKISAKRAAEIADLAVPERAAALANPTKLKTRQSLTTTKPARESTFKQARQIFARLPPDQMVKLFVEAIEHWLPSDKVREIGRLIAARETPGATVETIGGRR